MSESRTNRLAHEKSPYLLQHANNPVDWYPWGEEAFAKARQENKPIFLSIGYSTCHWCHVMAHESFENRETAEIMNREFVNIKLDREERPDIDRVYMTFVQATTGSGGWPMSVWLTPDLQPFVGATYFPPEDRSGHPGFKKVLTGIAQAWKEKGDKLSEQGQKIVAALRESQASQSAGISRVDAAALRAACEHFARTFDAQYGGFGNAPKFPRPVVFNFLMSFYAHDRPGAGSEPTSSSDPREDAASALEIVLFTLRKMADGGMHDHIGGGFHRYSVDRYWHVPHFEKMLYDQAQLATSYLDAFQITRDEQYRAVVRDTLDYVAREMTSSEGGFYSAEDADSLEGSVSLASQPGKSDAAAPSSKKKEGAFYVWAEREIDESLGKDAELFKFHFGVQAHGNAPPGSDPHDEFRGKNILMARPTFFETGEKFGKTSEQVREVLNRCRRILFEVRSGRPRPHLDDKVIAAWNGLMISAYARASQVLEEPLYLATANRAAEFIREKLYDADSGLLYRSYRNGRSNIEGFADDYTFVIQGLLDLYEAGFNVEWLKLATRLQQTLDRLFLDEKNGGYFSTSGKDSSVVLRIKDDNDSAEPAASSVAALNLLRLAQLRNDDTMTMRARQTINAFGTTLSHFASAMPQMLVAVIRSLEKPRQIVIAGKRESADTEALLREVHRHFLPNKALILADGDEGQNYLSEQNKAIRAMSPIDGRAAAYVCNDFTCQAPVTESKRMADLLER